MDSVFSDQVVKLITMINPNEMCTTTEIQLCILPVGTSGQLLRPRNVTGWITPLCTFNLIETYNGVSRPSLLIESTDSMIYIA